tara:strand:+ start:3396 stop:3683 length:288 start_codon:yes stop_codon:yes gene_type:complete
MIYKTINENEFINEFGNSGQYANNFSREGLKALYEHLSELENLELDVIALCCEFAEYDSFNELIADYSQYTTLESIENNTTVLETDSGGYVIQQF